jgi:RNA polymerase sigma-70 factor (ECF subfamily)
MLYSNRMDATRLLGTTETEEELMGRVAEGDVRAFEVVYDRYSRQAYSLARRITGGAAGAEEATQDAFLSLWRGAASFDPKRARLATWLLALVRYRSIDWLRRSAPRALPQGLTQGTAEETEAPERTEKQVLVSEECDRARRLVAELPPEQREVIDLAYFEGYTHTEIAARVGIPLGTVKGRARLGLLKLRHAAECDAAPVAAA